MIEVYCQGETDWVREALDDLALRYDAVRVDEGGAPEDLLPDAGLPALRDGGVLFCGTEEIRAHLRELADFREWWYLFQSDTCYCDREGNIITQSGSSEPDR